MDRADAIPPSWTSGATESKRCAGSRGSPGMTAASGCGAARTSGTRSGSWPIRPIPVFPALLIQICSSDLYRMFYPGGAFSLESALYWALRSRGDRDDPPSAETLDRGVAGLPLRDADNRAAEDVPFFNDWVDHPERDDYWIAVDGDSRPERLQAPVLLMAGWYDPFLPTMLDDFVRIRRSARRGVAGASRLVVGPWAHAETVALPSSASPRNYRLESFAPTVPWFDAHLRPSAPPDHGAAPVRLYVMC